MGNNIISFNETCQGFSHIASGKVCQDSSISWTSEDKTCHIAIVCDGHGSNTYVRSDKGSKFAAEITLNAIKDFIVNTSPLFFLDKENAVTARPEIEDDFFTPSKKKVIIPTNADETDARIQLEIQNQNFYDAVKNHREQDGIMQRLFARIILEWKEKIKEDSINVPFTSDEKTKLGKNRIEKAYGTTLIAFARTPLYWFAFHLGDGKLLCCNQKLEWREPVPWDCRCFLNKTTSLCQNDCIYSFRYAFNGKGEFPAAVFMGSDGIDDSYGTLLNGFYSKLLSTFVDYNVEEARNGLRDFLPILSKKGSRDDMSVAGIIDLEMAKGCADIYKKRKKVAELTSECENQKKICESLKIELDTLKTKKESIDKEFLNAKEEKEKWYERFLFCKEKEEIKSNELEAIKYEVTEKHSSLNSEAEKYKEIHKNNTQAINVINLEIEEVYNSSAKISSCKKEEWEESKKQFFTEKEEHDIQRRKEIESSIKAREEEATKNINDAKFASDEDEVYLDDVVEEFIDESVTDEMANNKDEDSSSTPTFNELPD